MNSDEAISLPLDDQIKELEQDYYLGKFSEFSQERILPMPVSLDIQIRSTKQFRVLFSNLLEKILHDDGLEGSDKTIRNLDREKVRLLYLVRLACFKKEIDIEKIVERAPKELESSMRVYRKTLIDATDGDLVENLAIQKRQSELELHLQWLKEARLEIPDLSDWLKQRPPDDWHLAVAGTTFDGDLQLLEWIVSQPACDVSTAIFIFWQGAPETYLSNELNGRKSPARLRAQFLQIFRTISENLQTDFYQQQSFSFPHSKFRSNDWPTYLKQFSLYNQSITRFTELGQPAPWQLPEVAFKKFDGHEPKSEYVFEEYNVYPSFDSWLKSRAS